MSSIDDFSQLRPDADAIDDAYLDRLWARVVADPVAPSGVDRAAGERDADRFGGSRSRRFAIGGAAASIIVCVGALIVVSNRAEAPSAVLRAPTTQFPPTTQIPSTDAGSASPDVASAVGEPPLWGITADGWRLVEFDDRTASRDDTIEVFAGPRGVDDQYVVIVSGMSDPLAGTSSSTREAATGLFGAPVPGTDTPDVGDADPSQDSGSDGDDGGSDPISAQRFVNGAGNFLVVAGGLPQSTAADVFRASIAGSALPEGFEALPVEASYAVRRTVRYRFENDGGESIVIDVEAGGRPRYAADVQHAERVNADGAGGGVGDVADVVTSGGFERLLRTGFWVTSVRSLPSTDTATEFASLADLVGIVTPDERTASLPSDPAVATNTEKLAIGDQVMLGAAHELTDVGFAVDAVENRSFADGLARLTTLAERGRLPETVVVALTANSSVEPADLDAMMVLLAEVDNVVVVTGRTNGSPAIVEPDNDLIRGLPDRFANVKVLDWAMLGDECSGDCFAGDGLTLGPDGRRFFADLVAGSGGN